MHLELYVNSIKGGFHTLMLVQGARRTQHPFTSQEVDEMLVRARDLMDQGYEGTAVDGSLRVIDPGRTKVLSGDARYSLKQLRLWTSPDYGRREPVQPQVREEVLGLAFA